MCGRRRPLPNNAGVGLREGEDWWGTAANVQDGSEDAPDLARQALEARIDWTALDEGDATLLRAALEWRDES